MLVTWIEVLGAAGGLLTIIGVVGRWALQYTRLDIMAEVAAKIDAHDNRARTTYMPTAVLIEKIDAINRRIDALSTGLDRLEASAAPVILAELKTLLLELRSGTRTVA